MEVLDTTIINVALPQMAGNLGATTRGDRVGQHVVHPRQRRRAADDRVFHRAVRSAALPDVLDPALHRRVVSLRNVAQPERARDLAPLAGRGRRGAALDGAGDAAADLPARAAGHGPGHLPARHHRRADAWSHARRMDHRQLHVELVLLHQHPHRHRRRRFSSRRSCTIPTGARRIAPVDWLGIGLLIAGIGSLQYVLEEGNRNDWFADAAHPATLDRFGDLSDHAGLVGAVVAQQASRSSTSACCTNRDLSASIFLFVVLGFGLYGGTFLFPLFTQTILGLHADRDGTRR